MATAADDLAGVLDCLPVERVGVVGWSAGGRVALALAARRPDLVDRVVVLATPAPDEEVPRIERGRARRARAAAVPGSRGGPCSPGRAPRLGDSRGSSLTRGPVAPRRRWGRRGVSSSRRRAGSPGRDAASGVRPGRTRPRSRHRRVLPAALGLRARGRPGEDASPLRVTRSARRPATRALVVVAAAECKSRGRAGSRPPARRPDVGSSALARVARSRSAPLVDSPSGVEEFSAA